MAGIHSSVEESANFFRLMSLVVDLGSEVLRDVLLHLVKSRTLEAVIQANSAIIDGLIQKKAIFPQQYDLLMKVPPDPEEFDISLLVKVFRNICPNLTPHGFDWRDDPDGNDFSLAADLKRLQNIRNCVYAHTSSTKVTTMDFEAIWSDLSDIIDRISQHGSGKFQDIRQRIQMRRQENLDPIGSDRMLEIFVKWQKQDEENKEMLVQRLDNQVHVNLQLLYKKMLEYSRLMGHL